MKGNPCLCKLWLRIWPTKFLFVVGSGRGGFAGDDAEEDSRFQHLRQASLGIWRLPGSPHSSVPRASSRKLGCPKTGACRTSRASTGVSQWQPKQILRSQTSPKDTRLARGLSMISPRINSLTDVPCSLTAPGFRVARHCKIGSDAGAHQS